jgi:hypothetical protein
LQQATGDVQAKFKSVNRRTDKEGNSFRHEGTAVAETSSQQKPRLGKLIPIATFRLKKLLGLILFSPVLLKILVK